MSTDQWFIGDKLLVNTDQAALAAIGITDPYQVGWILNGKIKTVDKIDGNKLHIIDERNVSGFLWVYKSMVKRWPGAGNLG